MRICCIKYVSIMRRFASSLDSRALKNVVSTSTKKENQEVGGFSRVSRTPAVLEDTIRRWHLTDFSVRLQRIPGFLHFSFPFQSSFFALTVRRCVCVSKSWIAGEETGGWTGTTRTEETTPPEQSEQRHQNDGFGSFYPRAWSSHILDARRMGQGYNSEC